MSTNSEVYLYIPEEDSFAHLYAHWDGYYEYAGMQLLRNYCTLSDVQKLFEYGHISNYGVCLSKIGITPEKLKKNLKNAAMKKERWCRVDSFSAHYIDSVKPSDKIKRTELLKKWEKCVPTYVYVFINDRWYIPKIEYKQLVFEVLTYGKCKYFRHSNGTGGIFNTVDVVVRYSNTGTVYTYNYVKANKFALADYTTPAVTLINKLADEVEMKISKRGDLAHLGDVYKQMQKSALTQYSKMSVVSKIKEIQRATKDNESFLCEETEWNRSSIYTIISGDMSFVANAWSYGVQLLCNVDAKQKTRTYYCRINLPEFEIANATMLNILGLKLSDLVVIDGFRWVKVSRSLWTQTQYKQFVQACDEKSAHTLQVINDRFMYVD